MRIELSELMQIAEKLGYELDALLTAMNQMAIKAFLTSENEFGKFNKKMELAAKYKKHLSTNSSSKLKEELSQEERDIKEVIEFLDILTSAESKAGEALIFQQSLIDESRLIPSDEFKKLNNFNFETIQNVGDPVNYIKTIIKNSKKKVQETTSSLASIYSFDELRALIEALDEEAKLQSENFAILIQHDGNMLSFLYDSKNQRCMVISPENENLLPMTKEIYELNEIIINQFRLPRRVISFIAFEVKIFTNVSNKKGIEKLVASLKVPVELHADNYKHSYFLQMKKQLGYATVGGICFGLASMAIQAHLCGRTEFEKFRSRIDFIAQNPNFFSNNTTDITYQKIKDRIIIKRDAARDKIKRQAALKKQPLPKYIPVNVELTAEEQNALEVAEFFEGIAIFQSPEKYADIINRNLISQAQIIEISQEIQSHVLNNISGMYKAAFYLGIYDRKNGIKDFMSIINEKSKDLACSFALLITSSDHAITLLHNAGSRYWTYVDANTMRIIRLHPLELGKYVYKALECEILGSTAAVCSTIITSGKNKDEIQKLVSALQQSNEFTNLQEIKYWVASRQINLVYMAAKYNLASIIITAANSRSNNINSLIDKNVGNYNPTIAATTFGHQQAVKILVDAKTLAGEPSVDLNKQTPEGETASHIAARLHLYGILQIFINARDEHGTFRANLNLITKEGKTPIWIALEKGYHNILKMLAAAKYDDGKPRVDLSFKFQNRSLVDQAFFNNDLDSFKLLEEFGPNIDVDRFDAMGDKIFDDFLNALAVKNTLLKQIEDTSFENNVEAKKLKQNILNKFKKDHLQFIKPAFTKKMDEKIAVLQSQLPKQSYWLNSWWSIFSINQNNQLPQSDLIQQIQLRA